MAIEGRMTPEEAGERIVASGLDPGVNVAFGCLLGIFIRLIGEEATRVMIDVTIDMMKMADAPRADAAVSELYAAIKPRTKG